MIKVKCKMCGNIFEAEKKKKNNFCSKICQKDFYKNLSNRQDNFNYFRSRVGRYS